MIKQGLSHVGSCTFCVRVRGGTLDLWLFLLGEPWPLTCLPRRVHFQAPSMVGGTPKLLSVSLGPGGGLMIAEHVTSPSTK